MTSFPRLVQNAKQPAAAGLRKKHNSNGFKQSAPYPTTAAHGGGGGKARKKKADMVAHVRLSSCHRVAALA
jgi:hypothetical protein